MAGEEISSSGGTKDGLSDCGVEKERVSIAPLGGQ